MNIQLIGDGIIHEVVNGIMEERDKEKSHFSSKVIQLGIIPTGSGNALANSFHLDNAVVGLLSVLRGSSQPIYISSVHKTPPRSQFPPSLEKLSPQIMYSCCVVSWGLHAQIVSKSNFARWLGNFKFWCIGVLGIIFLHCYRGKVFVWDSFARKHPSSVNLLALHQSTSNNSTSSSSSSSSSLPSSSNQPLSSTMPSPLTIPSTSTSTSNPLVSTSSSTSSSPWFCPMNQSPFLLPTSIFTYFISSRVSELEKNFPMTPDAHPTLSSFDLISVSQISRKHLLKFFNNVNQKTHLNLDNVLYLKTKAFALDLEDDNDHISSSWWKRKKWWWPGWWWNTREICVDGEIITLEKGEGLVVKTLDHNDQIFKMFSLKF